MAPNTALVFLLLSAVLILVGSNRFPGLARFAALSPLVIVGARLSEYLTGHNLTVDHWLFHFPADHLGLAPVESVEELERLAARHESFVVVEDVQNAVVTLAEGADER